VFGGQGLLGGVRVGVNGCHSMTKISMHINHRNSGP
jgi:hypothetical protein